MSESANELGAPKVLPCPFCGDVPKFAGPYERDERRYYVIIPDCRCHAMEVYAGDSFSEASIETGIAEWNQRRNADVSRGDGSASQPQEKS